MPQDLRHVASNPALGNAIGRGHRTQTPAVSRNDASHGHRRKASSSSVNSNQSAPLPSIDEIMRGLGATPGGKIAEDARKALRLAERQRDATSPTILHHPIPRRSSSRAHRMPDVPATPSPVRQQPGDYAWASAERTSPGSAADAAFDAIGNALLAPDISSEDPFEYAGHESDVDDITALYAQLYADVGSDAGSNWPEPADMRRRGATSGVRPGAEDVMLDGAVAGNAPTTLLRNRSQMVRPKTNTFAHVAPTQNALAIFWRGDAPQNFALITHGSGSQGADDAFPIEVAAKHTQVVEMPNQWSGRVQRVTGTAQDPATRCDIQFGGYKGLTFFGVNYAYGNNGPAVIRSSPNGDTAGSPFRAMDVAPQQVIIRDAGGHRVLVGTEHVTNQQRLAVHKFYRDFFDHAEQGAIIADDESGVVATRDRHVLIDFYV